MNGGRFLSNYMEDTFSRYRAPVPTFGVLVSKNP